MATVMTHAVMSLDGYIAHADDSVDPLFDWYGNGDTPLVGKGGPFGGVSAASAAYTQPFWDAVGAHVMGRHMFDTTDGWQGDPVAGDHIFVLTHEPPTDWPHAHKGTLTFVTDLTETIRLASDLAGDGRTVAVCAGDVGGQALAAGLVDVVAVDLVPVVFGSGVRYFGDAVPGSPDSPFALGDPSVFVQGDRVTHLQFPVRR